jgi:hypothetical protein
MDGWSINIIGLTTRQLSGTYLSICYPFLTRSDYYRSRSISVLNLNYPYPVPYREKYIRVEYMITLYSTISVPFLSLPMGGRYPTSVEPGTGPHLVLTTV